MMKLQFVIILLHPKSSSTVESKLRAIFQQTNFVTQRAMQDLEVNGVQIELAIQKTIHGKPPASSLLENCRFNHLS